MLRPEKEQHTVSQFREWLNRLYRRAFRPRLDIRTQEIAQVLKEVDLFAEFNRGTIRSLAESMHVRQYKRDEYIYRERDPGLGLYIVQSGRIRLLTEDQEGNLHESHQVGDYEIFGHFALLGDFRRFETAQAITQTSVLGYFRPELKTMLKRDPKTAGALLYALASYAADQHVALYSFLVEKEGKVVATRLYDIATKQEDRKSTSASFVVRP